MHSLPTSVQYEMQEKINLEAEMWQGKQQCLPIGDKKWADDCPPSPTGSAANDISTG